MTLSSTGPRRRATPADPDAQRLARQIASTPEGRRRRRQQRLGQLDEAANEPKRPPAKSQLGAPPGAEEVGHQWKVGSPDALEEQRRSTRGDDATMDLRHLQERIDLAGHDCQIAVEAQLIQELSEIAETAVVAQGSSGARRV